MLAARAIREAGVTLRGTLKCVYTADEEKNGPDGSIFLLDECGLDADYTIVCEPTGWTKPDGRWGMGIAVANGGIPGRNRDAGHQDPYLAARHRRQCHRQDGPLLTAFETMTFTHKPARLAGGTPPMVSIVRIKGGVTREMQFTPDICHGVIAVVGILPGMTPQSVMADIKRVIDTCMAADPDLKATARPYPGALFVDGTLEQDELRQPDGRARPLLSAHSQARRRRSTARTPSTTPFASPSVARAAITFGPGEDGWPPVNEYIHIDKAVAATKILALTVLDLLGTAE